MYDWIEKILAACKTDVARRHLKKILWGLLLLLIVFVEVSLAPYFYKHAEFLLRGGQGAPAAETEMVFPHDWLSIPSLAIEAPVIYVTEKTEEAYQRGLQDGVVHYPETALPGEPGNVYLFGHSSDLLWTKGSYKTVFALLPDIQIGDEIYLSNGAGDVFTYVVTETMIVQPADLSVLDQFNGSVHYLTIQTSYPIGTALKRFIVRAELLDQGENDGQADDN